MPLVVDCIGKQTHAPSVLECTCTCNFSDNVRRFLPLSEVTWPVSPPLDSRCRSVSGLQGSLATEHMAVHKSPQLPFRSASRCRNCREHRAGSDFDKEMVRPFLTIPQS